MTEPSARPTLGILSLVSGLVAAASVAMIAATSLLPGFNPPDWVRIATMAPLPIALIASVALGVAAVVRRAGRVWAVAGLAVSGAAVAGFVTLIGSVSY